MADQQEKWEALDEEDETLSLSDLPAGAADEVDDDDDDCKSSDAADDHFEFRISAAGGLLSISTETDMCAADEVFFQGQILPLRPSISSDGGVFGPSPGGSRSDSLDQYSSAILDLGFNSTSRSNSSGSSGSSRCISRSHSSSSRSSSTGEHPRASLSNNFYAHPSPTPQVRVVRKANAGRKSASSAPPGWGVFRLGIAKAPELELYDMRSRRSNRGSVSGRKSNAEAGRAKIKLPRACTAKSDEASGGAAKAQKEAPPRPVVGRGFSCRCSPDAVEPIAISKLTIRKKQKEMR